MVAHAATADHRNDIALSHVWRSVDVNLNPLNHYGKR